MKKFCKLCVLRIFFFELACFGSRVAGLFKSTCTHADRLASENALLSQVDHHKVKMHTAFIKNKGDGDFTEWRKAWTMADSDNDDLIPVQEAPRIFKVQSLLL